MKRRVVKIYGFIKEIKNLTLFEENEAEEE